MSMFSYGTPRGGVRRAIHFLVRRYIRREQFWWLEEES
jgi:hypothetical protein